jgi:hypothetical protein
MARLFGQDWDTIIPCHGTIVDSDAKQQLKRFIGAA